MEENKQDGIAVFDTLFTNNHICMLKVLLPFLPPASQKSIAVYIKYLEFQYTLQYFSKHPFGLSTSTSSHGQNPPNLEDMWEKLMPYCNSSEKQKFQQMRNMMQTFQNMKDMMEMMDTMKELFPEGLNGADISSMMGNSNGMDFSQFSQMSELFSAFTSMNASPQNE